MVVVINTEQTSTFPLHSDKGKLYDRKRKHRQKFWFFVKDVRFLQCFTHRYLVNHASGVHQFADRYFSQQAG
jgi:hypothetical protein